MPGFIPPTVVGILAALSDNIQGVKVSQGRVGRWMVCTMYVYMFFERTDESDERGKKSARIFFISDKGGPTLPVTVHMSFFFSKTMYSRRRWHGRKQDE